LRLGELGGAPSTEGVLEIHSCAIAWFLRRCTLIEGGASAMTLGHVVIGTSQEALESTRRHERVHVRQCERWGPLFIPAYVLCSVYLFLRGRNAYLDNPFEIAARAHDMGKRGIGM
jgi:hypothetical protein